MLAGYERLLLPPTLYLLQVVERRRQVALAATVIVGITVFPPAYSLVPVRLAFELFMNYVTLFAAALVWVGYWCVLYRAIQTGRSGTAFSSMAPRALSR